ncbi:hypothetical protein AOXY_G7024 [Acipenser oxyrinchus oxyrinchus]|uniref:D-beta-hydroxybutyrate dehydrogenase, mitochondrial n=1 Tax=Acipenser oxyrinchus oxyrinchus TaxID=40147 RepID=A0AAD8G9G3_ACIOX|nr:hypothetical protein AOXY_G7024 [Acipenser oxyrinchus oxyrinchus]
MLLLLFWKKSCVFNPQGRAVFITGCDSGFGHELAKRLDHMGFVVFAACLFPDGEGAQSLVRKCSSQLKVIKVDVTQDEDVEQAKKIIESNLPEKGLWGVVSNAGISDWSETEWNTIQQYHKMADVNLFGSIRTTLPFIPLIRASKGRMVFVSSILAFIYVPNLSVYSVTKRAVEAFADCLRVELAIFGVKVCIIEPGNFGSVTKVLREKAAEEIWNQFNDEHKKMFNQEYLHIITDYVNTQLRAGNKNINLVTDAMVDALVSPTPNTRYLVDNRMNKIFFFMFPYLPTCVADSFFACSGIYRKRKSMLFSEQVQ